MLNAEAEYRDATPNECAHTQRHRHISSSSASSTWSYSLWAPVYKHFIWLRDWCDEILGLKIHGMYRLVSMWPFYLFFHFFREKEETNSCDSVRFCCLIMFELARSISNFRNMSHENQIHTIHSLTHTMQSIFERRYRISWRIFVFKQSLAYKHKFRLNFNIKQYTDESKNNLKSFSIFFAAKKKMKKLKWNDKFSTQRFP